MYGHVCRLTNRMYSMYKSYKIIYKHLNVIFHPDFPICIFFVIVKSIVTQRSSNLISVEEPEVFEPEDRFCPENGIATFVDSPPVDSLSCVPAPGPVQCSLQGTSTVSLTV